MILVAVSWSLIFLERTQRLWSVQSIKDFILLQLSVMPHQQRMMRLMAHLMENLLVWTKNMMTRNNEQSLASKVCTFTSSGRNFMEQHWYFYYTCDRIVSKGCCSMCVNLCHRAHKVVYSHLVYFFYHYGVGWVRGTSCLYFNPHKYVSSNTTSLRGDNNVEPLLPLPDERDHLHPSNSDSNLEDNGCMENEKPFKLSISKE